MTFCTRLQTNRSTFANAGPMNPGKSTLFNALLKKPEVFKTADIRQTADNQEEPYRDGAVLIDTPGCNSAEVRDDTIACQAFSKADAILFVHNITTGSFQLAEINILKYLRELFGQDFTSRVIVVCNRIDEAETEDTKRNIADIQKQLMTYLGKRLDICQVSSTYFLQAMEEKQAGNQEVARELVRESGIPALEDKLIALIRMGKKSKATITAIKEKLRQQQNNLRSQLDYHRNLTRSRIQAFKKKWTRLLNSTIKPAWDECSTNRP